MNLLALRKPQPARTPSLSASFAPAKILPLLCRGTRVALLLACLIGTQARSAELTFQTIYKFFPASSVGLFPSAWLAEGNDGNFYGTTIGYGGYNYGTVFKITPAGVLTNLFSFNGTNGWFPGGLTLGKDGCFYGVTANGGSDFPAGSDNGTVFKITTNGVLTSLTSLSGANGYSPFAPLRQGRDGLFYGIARHGGAYNSGTIFKITTNGAMTVLLSLDGTNGANPALSGLAEGSDGNLYGTATYGGSNFNGAFTGLGTVFELTTNGVLTSPVFFNGANGSNPWSGLALATDQAFYGTTLSGGDFGLGTIFTMTMDGALKTLLSFDGTNGARPAGGVTQGRDGNGTNGRNPAASLILAHDGNLYGAMADEQKNYSLDGSAGSIFRLIEPPSIMSITSTNASVTLTWNSFTNGMYRIEYSSSLAAVHWTALTPDIKAMSLSSSLTISLGSATERYWRVILLP